MLKAHKPPTRSVLQCVAVCCSVLQCVLLTAHTSPMRIVLQCVAICCTYMAARRAFFWRGYRKHTGTRRQGQVCYSVMQCVSVHYRVLCIHGSRKTYYLCEYCKHTRRQREVCCSVVQRAAWVILWVGRCVLMRTHVYVCVL